MPKISLGIISAIGLIVLNFSFSEKKQHNRDFSLKNMKILQASAGEIWCDSKNNTTCTIGEAKGTGYLWVDTN